MAAKRHLRSFERRTGTPKLDIRHIVGDVYFRSIQTSGLSTSDHLSQGNFRVWGLWDEAVPEREPEYLLKQAGRCRSIATSTIDAKTRATVIGMANEYEERAAALQDNQKDVGPNTPS